MPPVNANKRGILRYVCIMRVILAALEARWQHVNCRYTMFEIIFPLLKNIQ